MSRALLAGILCLIGAAVCRRLPGRSNRGRRRALAMAVLLAVAAVFITGVGFIPADRPGPMACVSYLIASGVLVSLISKRSSETQGHRDEALTLATAALAWTWGGSDDLLAWGVVYEAQRWIVGGRSDRAERFGIFCFWGALATATMLTQSTDATVIAPQLSELFAAASTKMQTKWLCLGVVAGILSGALAVMHAGPWSLTAIENNTQGDLRETIVGHLRSSGALIGLLAFTALLTGMLATSASVILIVMAAVTLALGPWSAQGEVDLRRLLARIALLQPGLLLTLLAADVAVRRSGGSSAEPGYRTLMVSWLVIGSINAWGLTASRTLLAETSRPLTSGDLAGLWRDDRRLTLSLGLQLAQACAFGPTPSGWLMLLSLLSLLTANGLITTERWGGLDLIRLAAILFATSLLPVWLQAGRLWYAMVWELPRGRRNPVQEGFPVLLSGLVAVVTAALMLAPGVWLRAFEQPVESIALDSAPARTQNSSEK